MQYILSEEEYRSLIERNEQYKEKHKAVLQDLCTKVADHMPIVCSWNKTGTAKPWGCVLTNKKVYSYCDECPVKKVCPYPNKEFSK